MLPGSKSCISGDLRGSCIIDVQVFRSNLQACLVHIQAYRLCPGHADLLFGIHFREGDFVVQALGKCHNHLASQACGTTCFSSQLISQFRLSQEFRVLAAAVCISRDISPYAFILRKSSMVVAMRPRQSIETFVMMR